MGTEAEYSRGPDLISLLIALAIEFGDATMQTISGRLMATMSL